MVAADEWIRGEAEREGLNFLIQSAASDFTLQSALWMCQRHKKDFSFRTISFVHDSIIFEVRKSNIAPFLETLEGIMIHPPGVSVPMEIDVKIGVTLGSLTELTKDNSGKWVI